MWFGLKIYVTRFDAIQHLHLLDLGMQNTKASTEHSALGTWIYPWGK